MKSPKIIAEIGCNHKGDMAIAKEMLASSKNVATKSCLLQKSIMLRILIRKTPTERLMESTVSFWSSTLTSIASCRNGARSSVWNIPPQCGISPRQRKSARCIPI